MTAGTQYIYNGTTWAAANTPPPTPAPNVQDFTSSDTWYKPEGATRVRAECIGAGGSGANDAAVSSYMASGGAGGAYASREYVADELPPTVPVTIGAGGEPVTRMSSPGAYGQNGGASSFSPSGAAETKANGGVGGRYGNGGAFAVAVTTTGDGDIVSAGGVGIARGNESGMSIIGAGFSPDLGGGAGQGKLFNSSTTNQIGGKNAAAMGRLGGGNGGEFPSTSVAATAPGGGGAWGSSSTASGAGAPGAVRVTTYFD